MSALRRRRSRLHSRTHRPTGTHDAPVDLIVTPERVIDCRGRSPRPVGGICWAELTAEKIAAIPLLAALRP